MKTTEDKIKQCEKLLGELKEELLKESKPEFQVGDWVTIHTSHQCSINKIGDVGRIIKPAPILSTFDWIVKADGTLGDTGGMQHSNMYLRHATEQEIKDHLIKEAERRFTESQEIKSLSCIDFRDDEGDEVEDGEVFGFSGTERIFFNYNIQQDALLNHGRGLGCLYKQGKWAEIIEDNKIKLNDKYEAEILEGGDVKVGCQTFSKEIVNELYEACNEKK